jgi:phosphopantetheine adenylyltransferase
MEAIVVSEETLVGGQAINLGRKRAGLAPLHVVVVSLVWPRSGRAKLSSTDLRLQDAAAAAAAAVAGMGQQGQQGQGSGAAAGAQA